MDDGKAAPRWGSGQETTVQMPSSLCSCRVPTPHDVPGTQEVLDSTAHTRVSLSPGSVKVSKGGGDLPLQGPSGDSALTFVKPPQAF